MSIGELQVSRSQHFKKTSLQSKNSLTTRQKNDENNDGESRLKVANMPQSAYVSLVSLQERAKERQPLKPVDIRKAAQDEMSEQLQQDLEHSNRRAIRKILSDTDSRALQNSSRDDGSSNNQREQSLPNLCQF